MLTITCLYCGAKYHTPRSMTACTVCGQAANCGWLYEEASRHVSSQTRPVSSSPSRVPTARRAA